MKIEQATWSPADDWVLRRGALNGVAAQFVLAFGGRQLVEDPARYADIRARYPGPRSTITGFYSYGELAPAMARSSFQLHNQTVTITGFSEA